MGSRLPVVCLGHIHDPLAHFIQDLMIIQQFYGPSMTAIKSMIKSSH